MNTLKKKGRSNALNSLFDSDAMISKHTSTEFDMEVMSSNCAIDVDVDGSDDDEDSDVDNDVAVLVVVIFDSLAINISTCLASTSSITSNMK